MDFEELWVQISLPSIINSLIAGQEAREALRDLTVLHCLQLCKKTTASSAAHLDTEASGTQQYCCLLRL